MFNIFNINFIITLPMQMDIKEIHIPINHIKKTIPNKAIL